MKTIGISTISKNKVPPGTVLAVFLTEFSYFKWQAMFGLSFVLSKFVSNATISACISNKNYLTHKSSSLSSRRQL